MERQAFDREVVSSNLPLTLGDHSSGSLTIARCKIGTRLRSGQSELTLRIHYNAPWLRVKLKTQTETQVFTSLSESSFPHKAALMAVREIT